MKEREFEGLEREMAAGMTRVDAPAGFLDAVMEAAGREKRPSGSAGWVLAFPQRQRWIGSVAASLLVAAMLFGGLEHRRAAERGRAERDFARSLAITDRALEHTRQELQRAGVALDE